MNKRQKKKRNCPYIQLKKYKPNDVALFIMDMDDDNFDLDVSINFVQAISNCNILKANAYVMLPKFINVQPIDKEYFRKYLDEAEKMYEKM